MEISLCVSGVAYTSVQNVAREMPRLWKGFLMIRALVFDFDGLILDTEISAFQSWQEIYQAYQQDLPLEKWVLCIGTSEKVFEPYDYLASLVSQPLPRDEIQARRLQRHLELIAAEVALPGVETYIADARRLGLKLAVASSSSRRWVVGHLARLGLATHFDAIVCGDEVACVKPDPALYLAALDALAVQADEAIALEDSPNGVTAARRAGIFCVAIPNTLTSTLPLEHASLRLNSLADFPLEHLLTKVS